MQRSGILCNRIIFILISGDGKYFYKKLSNILCTSLIKLKALNWSKSGKIWIFMSYIPNFY